MSDAGESSLDLSNSLKDQGLTAGQHHEPSPGGDTEDTGDEICQNPEPPTELVGLLNADNIGCTVFSKHWLFTTLMRLLQVVEQQEDHDAKEGTDSTVTTGFYDLDDDLEDNLCKLWDMSMNQEVVDFLMEFKAIELLSGVIAKSRAPRATEICVGILGNMACTSSVRQEMNSNQKLLELLLSLLESPDAPTLVEVTRLLHVCISNDCTSATSWISTIKEMPHVFPSVLFIMQSSTNATLLKNTAEFVDKLMETDEDICVLWSTADLVLAVMEAIKQTGLKDGEDFGTFIHLLQLISTSEPGVQALASYAGEVFTMIMRYLVHLCIDDIVAVEDHMNFISSSFSVLVAVFLSWESNVDYLIADFQIMRCIVKILEVVYPKMKHACVKLTPRKRSSSRVLSEEADSRRLSNEICQNSFNSDAEAVDKNDTPSDDEEKKNATECVLSSEKNNDDQIEKKEKEEIEFARKMTDILYEVIQNLLVDVVTIMEKLPVAEADENSDHDVQNGQRYEAVDGEETASADSRQTAAKNETPKVLTYLDSQCDRHRLQCLLNTLNDVKDKNLISSLYAIGQKHGLHRLCRIIRDTFPLYQVTTA